MDYINLIVVVIFIVGVITLLLFIDLLVFVLQGKKFLRDSQKRKGFSDMLNYAAYIDDGIIICKDGSFLASWEYTSGDTYSTTDEERNNLSTMINNAIKDLGSGWIFYVDAVRTQTDAYSDSSESNFPDAVCQAIDNERRAFFNGQDTVYKTKTIITVVFTPPLLTEQKLTDLMFEDEIKNAQKAKDIKEQQRESTNRLIEKFKNEIDKLELRLGLIFKLKRLKTYKKMDDEGNEGTYDSLLEHLNFCITGKNQPIRLPSQLMYLDTIIGGHDFFSAITPKIDDTFVQAINIEGFPNDSYPGILNILADMPCEYRWNTRFIFMDEFESVAIMDKYRKKWRQKVRGFFDQLFNTSSGRIDSDALMMMQDSEDAINEVKSGYVSSGFYTSVVLVYDKSRERLEEVVQHVQRQIMKLGFSARVETVNATSAYIDSLPGHYHNMRQPIINTLNLSDMIPTNTIWTGLERCPCPMYPKNAPALMYCLTNGATPFRLNLHVRDLGHTFVFGPTGAGKSTLLATLAAQLRRYRGMHIYAFDKGLSMYPLTKAAGGSHFALAGDDASLNFCPLAFLETQGDRAWASEWIENILLLNDVKITPAQRNIIAQAIESMHNTGSKTLTDFTNSVQDISIREALKPYTIEGQLGHLLDASEDGLSFSDFCTFEIEDLMNLSPKYSLPVLLYLFRRIEKNLKGEPSVIFLDEAWLMLGNPVFREKIREWLKVLRKANCAVVMATQSLSDTANSGILDVITESTATKIFLANVYAKEDNNIELYKGMGLNSRQIEIISQMIPKRQYYYVSENGRRLFELALGPLTLSFVGATDKESIATIKALEADYGDSWPAAWLESRGINLEVYL